MTIEKPARPPAWVPRFLDALRAGASIKRAASDAGINESTPYQLRRKDRAFLAEWLAIRPSDGRRASGRTRIGGNARVDRFLAELAETSNVAAACTVAGLSASQVYRLRRTDPDFARRWFAALAEGYDNLEMELLGRLRAGEGADAARGKFDTATAFRCLAAHRENVAREKGRRTLEQEVATIESINAKIDRLRLNQKASDAAIAAARKANRERRIAPPSGSEAVGRTKPPSGSEAVGPKNPSSRSEALGRTNPSSRSDATGGIDGA